MHVLGTGVPRRLGVTRSASGPKAAQALGCSLTPGLRISFGRVTCMARAASVPGLWTLGFLLLCGVCVWVRIVFGLEVWATPRHSWLGLWGGCVFVCPLRLYPATPGWGVRCGCVCLGSGFRCAPPLLAGVFDCVRVCVPALLVPRHSWLGCVEWACVLGLGFRLRPTTPGRGVGVCVCLCARPAYTSPLLAGMCGVGVCARAQASDAPRHSWLGCRGVCVFVSPLRLYPATPGWGVWCGCVCLGSGFSCAPPPLAGVLGCVCACVRAALIPRHSWLGCAAWVCVLGLRFRLCPATPGWGVGVRVCLCAPNAYTPPLLAGVCGVGLCAWARVSAAPRHPWLGCWGACVLVCAPHLYPATPGSGVWCGCVCLGSGFRCAPPLLAGVFVCVRVCVPAPLVPRHSWLGCVEWVCVLGLGFRLRPTTPGRGVGVCVCLCARPAYTPPLLAGMCGVGVYARARASVAPRHSWLGCRGVCVFVSPLRLYPATPGWGVWCGCVCLGSGFSCTPPPLAGVLGCVCACVRAALIPLHSWLGCAAWVCVVGLRFRLRPATPGSGVGVRVCLCARPTCNPATPGSGVWCGCVCLGSGFGCAPPLLAGFLGCVCVCVPAPLVPCHSWPGVCGVGVCLGSGFGCAPPLLAGVLGCVRVRVRAPLVPRQSWLGCAAWVCVLGLGFLPGPATPGWGVGMFVCLCARSTCTPPLLAGVCGVGVCAWARVPAAPCHSWLGCWGVCVFVCALRLYPATPGWDVQPGCVCLGSGFGCAPPFLAGVLGCVRFFVRALLVPRHSGLGCAAWVCGLGLGFRLRPASPGLGVGCVCARVPAPLVPRHSWLGSVVWVCVFGLGFRLPPATPGRGVGVFVCSCAPSACTPPILAGVCGVGVCALAWVSAAPRHSWLGCWGVCVFVCPLRL